MMLSTHAFEMGFTKQRVSLKKLVKFIQFFHEYAPTLLYYVRVKSDYILLVYLKDISCFACYKTVNIWRTRQVIEELKTPCHCVMIQCLTGIKTGQMIFHDTAPF